MNWDDVRDELLARSPVAPAEVTSIVQTGVYVWYDLDGALTPYYPSGFPLVDQSLPLYIGLAAKDSLAGRIVRTHLVNTRRSGLRRSLAALLHEELELQPGVIAYPKGKFDLAPASEARLTRWMLDNGLRVTWVTHYAPAIVEKPVIRDLLSPLNYTHAIGSPYRATMRRLRSELRPPHSADLSRHPLARLAINWNARFASRRPTTNGTAASYCNGWTSDLGAVG